MELGPLPHPNDIRPSDGARYVGSIPPNAAGSFGAGGVNGGTIRFEAVPNLIVRVVAFGAQGAFGEPEQINLFAPADTCDPEPNTNLAGIDINTGTADHMVVLDGGDQTVFYQDNIGPAGRPAPRRRRQRRLPQLRHHRSIPRPTLQ
jgi:hypothetical protein